MSKTFFVIAGTNPEGVFIGIRHKAKWIIFASYHEPRKKKKQTTLLRSARLFSDVVR